MTDHVKDQLFARIEELEKEKLELNEQLDIAQRERDEAARDLAMEQGHHQATRRSEEALAAHVARWKEWLGRDPEDDAGDWMDEGWAIAKESPTTSLARLKAQWQAEALGRVLAEVLTAVEADTVRAHLRNAMRKLRRQAEGDKA